MKITKDENNFDKITARLGASSHLIFLESVQKEHSKV